MNTLCAMFVTALSVFCAVLLVEHGAARGMWPTGRWGVGEAAVALLVLAVLLGAALCSASAVVGAASP